MCNCNSLVSVVLLSLKASLSVSFFSFLSFLSFWSMTTDRSSFSTLLWADRPLINALSILWTSFILFCNSNKAELWSSLRAGSLTSLLSISIASASWQFQENTGKTRELGGQARKHLGKQRQQFNPRAERQILLNKLEVSKQSSNHF